MKARYRKYTWLYMRKLRYISTSYSKLREYSKYIYFNYKDYKWQKQRNHLFRKFPNKYGFWKICIISPSLTAYTQ